jgi:ABC-type transport system involved in multi-copper enzyme maturation permease subunit
MLTRLALKELRETLWIAAAATVANLYVLLILAGVGFSKEQALSSIERLYPFNEAVATSFIMIGMCLAAGIGLRQTVGESARGTFQFLLNRPAQRWQLVVTKLLAGLGLYLSMTLLPLLLYVWWAATPGTHPSPFEWWMTTISWKGWFAGIIVYFGAFLAGIRPGRWHGTRLLPLVAAGLVALVLTAAPLWWWLPPAPLMLLADVLLVAAILFVSETRDYS